MENFFSLDLLINRVEEIQRLDQLETIQNLTRKNSLLQDVVTEYQRQWYCTIDLIEKTQEAVLILQEVIQHFNVEIEAAERAWLASWGIQRPEADMKMCYPADWM
jgi:uncharacterized protein YbgA (DUF1722 family)